MRATSHYGRPSREAVGLSGQTLLVTLYVRQRLCINFFVSRANFLTTLRSYLNVTCSCYFGLFNVGVNYSYIYLLNYN
jgi:hypothetical protein